MSRKTIIPAITVSIILMFSLPASAKKDKLPRKHDIFELGMQYKDVSPRLAAFHCEDLGSVDKECTIVGYPRRDDFLVLKFYKEELVSIAHFLEGVSFDEAFKDSRNRLGEPSRPAYKSDKAVSYVWEDGSTYITLTYLVPVSYLVYEIRDQRKEPLFRKARQSPK